MVVHNSFGSTVVGFLGALTTAAWVVLGTCGVLLAMTASQGDAARRQNRTPVAPPPWLTTREDTPLLFQLPGVYTHLPFDQLQFPGTIIDTPSTGLLFQVGPDNVTPDFTRNIVPFELVRNRQGWLYFVPPHNVWGLPLSSFTYGISDAVGWIDSRNLPLYVEPIDDAPQAVGQHHVGFNNIPLTDMILQHGDIDTDLARQLICITRLPGLGTLSWREAPPGPVTPTDNCRIGVLAQNLSYVGDDYVSTAPSVIFACDPAQDPLGGPETFDSFVWSVTTLSTSTQLSASAEDTFQYELINRPPASTTPSTWSIQGQNPVDIKLTADNLDGNEGPNRPRFHITSLPGHGTLYYGGEALYTAPTALLDSSPLLTYVANVGFAGVDSFTHSVADASDTRNCSYPVNITVSP